MKILIIGGCGFWGGKLAGSLSGIEGFEVIAAGRSGDRPGIIPLRWEDMDSLFAVFMQFDVIINAAPWLSPETMHRVLVWTILNKRIFIETSADINCTKYLMKWAAENKPEKGKGIFIFGAGVFPGLSNLLVRHLTAKYPYDKEIDLVIRYSIFSEAGRGTCKLMVSALLNPSFWKYKGQCFSGAPVGPLKRFDLNEGVHHGMRVFLSDVLYWTDMDNIYSFASYLSLKPDWINHVGRVFNVFPGWVKGFLESVFFAVRGKMFKGKSTSIEILASNRIGRSAVKSESLFDLAALSLAILVQKFASDREEVPLSGMVRFDEVLTIEEVLVYSKRHFPEMINFEFTQI